MRQITIATRVEKVSLTKREQLVVLEIGLDRIDSASAFVAYMSEEYGYSKSSVWYNLNRLKEKKLLDFATRDEPGKCLMLTRTGREELHALIGMGKRLEDFAEGQIPMPSASSSNLNIARNNLPEIILPSMIAKTF